MVEVETSLFPLQLLARIREIERQMGRRRVTPKGPRNIDIDILFYGRSVIASGGAGSAAPAHRAAPFCSGAAG